MNNRQEQIEQARRIIATGISEELVEVLHQQFPELKESEEERIRKALLRCCDDWDKGQFGCMAKEDVPAIRAYLEKQKEQHPIENIELEKEIKNWSFGLAGHDAEDWAGPTARYFFKLGQDSIKPAEWSEEDEYVINKVLNWAEIVNPTSTIFEKLPKEQFIERLKSLPERFNLQSKQEWSEEDEDKVDDICKLIEYATIIPRSGDDDTGIPPTRLNDKYKGELKAFVKSLRNLPTKSDTWKPNEEQMKALRAAMEHNVCYCGCNHQALKSLYNDLQKLL